MKCCAHCRSDLRLVAARCGACCAAPMLITSAQFLCQHMLARLVIGLRRLRSGAPAEEALTWNEWWQKGASSGDETAAPDCSRFLSR